LFPQILKEAGAIRRGRIAPNVAKLPELVRKSRVGVQYG